MAGTSSTRSAEQLTPLQIMTLILSVYVLIVLLVQATVPLSPETHRLLDQFDFVVCLVFLCDFFVRYWKAESKRAFLKWGWIDFISSIPLLDAFRIGRLVRIIRILRILRAFRSVKTLLNYLLRERRTTSMSAVFAGSAVLVVFAAVAILHLENGPESNIKSPADAFWWAFVTMTTVGYGDKFPVTAEGRIIACLLMVASVGLFGTFTGFVSSLFLTPAESERQETADERSEVGRLIQEIQELKEKVSSLEAAVRTQKPEVPGTVGQDSSRDAPDPADTAHGGAPDG